MPEASLSNVDAFWKLRAAMVPTKPTSNASKFMPRIDPVKVMAPAAMAAAVAVEVGSDIIVTFLFMGLAGRMLVR
jgi:hypothetical protein